MSINSNLIQQYLWQDAEIELKYYASPIINSKIFNRLDSISFLGILSPFYINKLKNKDSKSDFYGGTRRDHSIGVAKIMLEITKHLNLSEKAKTYGIAWGLVHDISTWPFSHTSEPAFQKITNLSSRKLREMIVEGSNELSSEFSLKNELIDMEIDLNILKKIYNKSNDIELDINLEEKLKSELKIIKNIINSPITPDTLEGIWRTGKIFDVQVPEPEKIYSSFQKTTLFSNDGLIGIEGNKSKEILSFWRKKRDIYRKFINKDRILHFESNFASSLTIYLNNKKMSLNELLKIKESDIIHILDNLQIKRNNEIIKYKQPLTYSVSDKRLGVKGNFLLNDLNYILLKGALNV